MSEDSIFVPVHVKEQVSAFHFKGSKDDWFNTIDLVTNCNHKWFWEKDAPTKNGMVKLICFDGSIDVEESHKDGNKDSYSYPTDSIIVYVPIEMLFLYLKGEKIQLYRELDKSSINFSPDENEAFKNGVVFNEWTLLEDIPVTVGKNDWTKVRTKCPLNINYWIEARIPIVSIRDIEYFETIDKDDIQQVLIGPIASINQFDSSYINSELQQIGALGSIFGAIIKPITKLGAKVVSKVGKKPPKKKPPPKKPPPKKPPPKKPPPKKPPTTTEKKPSTTKTLFKETAEGIVTTTAEGVAAGVTTAATDSIVTATILKTTGEENEEEIEK